MLGAVLKGLGKVECSEYWLYRTGFCLSSQQKATKGHGKADLVSRPGLPLSPRLLGPQFLCVRQDCWSYIVLQHL